MGIPKLGARAGGTLGLAFAVVGGGIQHVRKHAGDAARAQAEVRALNVLLAQHQQQIQILLAGVQSTQNSEAVALQQAAAAESSNAQLTLLAQDHQRIVQELSDSRDAAAVSHQQALQALREAKDLVEGARGEAVRRADEAEANLEARPSLQDSSEKEHNNALQELTASKDRAEEKRDHMQQELAVAQAEWSKTLEQAEVSHHVVMQGLQRQLHDAVEGRTAAEGELQRQLVAEQEARRAVRKDLVAAQREMEELVQHNSDLKRANANMGEEACRVRVEQEELRASFEAQSAELTSLKAQMERMGKDACDAAQLQQQVQDKERLLGEANDANKQAQAELAAQAAEKQRAISDLQEQVARLQDQVARAQVAPSPAQEEAAARLQQDMGDLQQQLSNERNLVVEAQSIISTTQEEGRRLLHRVKTADGQVYHLESEKLNLSTKLEDIQQQLPALQTQLEVACTSLEKTQGRAARLQQELQAAMAARQVAEGKVMETTQKLAASETQLKVANEKKEGSSRRKAELKREKSELEQQVQRLGEQLENARLQLEEEMGQRCYLDDQVEVLKTQLVSAGLEPAFVEQADDNDDAVFLPEVDTIVTEGKEDIEVMSPQSLGSAPGSPNIKADWGHLAAGASSSHDEQSLEVHSEGASGMEAAASSANAGSVADVASTADGGEGGDGGVKEDQWEEVTRAPRKPKAKVLPMKLKGSRSNAAHSDKRQMSRQGNASNAVEVPRPNANGDSSKSRQGNASNVLEVPRPRAK